MAEVLFATPEDAERAGFEAPSITTDESEEDDK